MQPSTSTNYDSNFSLINTSNASQINQQLNNDKIQSNSLNSTNLKDQLSHHLKNQKFKKSLVNDWSFQEMTVFYDALKQVFYIF